MIEVIALLLALVVWLNSIVTIKNGGGGVSTLALLIACGVVIAVMFWSVFSGSYWPVSIALVGIYSALLVVTLTPDEGAID